MNVVVQNPRCLNIAINLQGGGGGYHPSFWVCIDLVIQFVYLHNALHIMCITSGVSRRFQRFLETSQTPAA